jgi:hypothetical protein
MLCCVACEGYEGGKELKRRRSLVRYRHRWAYNIKMGLKEIGWER